MHAYIHTCIHTYIQTYIHTCMHADIHPSIHTCIDTYERTEMHACIHTCSHAYTHACIQTCIHTSTHTYTHNHTDIHMHTYTHTCLRGTTQASVRGGQTQNGRARTQQLTSTSLMSERIGSSESLSGGKTQLTREAADRGPQIAVRSRSKARIPHQRNRCQGDQQDRCTWRPHQMELPREHRQQSGRQRT